MSVKTSIRLRACGKTFANGVRALMPLDLEVRPGETLALLGPSGCGKTTLLRIIAGLEKPDTGGRIFFGDSDVTVVPTERRGIGMVFQSYALFPNLSVADNIGYGLRVRGEDLAQRERRVAEIMAMVHMTEFADRPIAELSGGQKQRVALARALAPAPRVLLLDEPLTALDAKLREALRAEMAELLERLHITTVLVTHDQSEAMSLGARVAVMSRGRLEQIASPQELYDAPGSAFVADFGGAMTRLHARVLNGRMELGGEETLHYRPHEVQLVNVTDGALTGEIVARFFLGGVTRYVVALADGQRLMVEAFGKSSASIGESLGLRFGQPTAVGSSKPSHAHLPD